MKLQKTLRHSVNAATPVLAACMVLLVVFSTVGTIVMVGVPYVESLGDENDRQTMNRQLDSVAEAFGELVGSKPGESDTHSIDPGMDGTVSINSDVTDKTVISYAFNSYYDFSVGSVDEGEIHISMNGGGTFHSADIFWFDFDTCFLAGTKVVMADGSYKNIEDIVVDDLVVAYDKNTGILTNCKVAQTFYHTSDEMTEYYLIINDNLQVTPNHLIYSAGEWVYAGNLRVGDPLFSRVENDEYQVNSIERVYERVPTFDLEVERCHTYFVSIDDSVDILVHNGEIDGGKVSTNNPPYVPSNLYPEDDATGISINVILSWTGGDPDLGDTVTYDVRFFEYAGGFIPNPLPTVSYGQEATTYDPGTMNYNTQYYWQIVAYDNHDATTEGPTWSFTTETENNPPNTPSNPSPEDDATGVDIDADLSWICSDPDGDPLTYDVRFYELDGGIYPNPLPTVSYGQEATTYDPGTMNYNTTYYWQIVAYDDHSHSTEGPTWRFTTEIENNPPDAPSISGPTQLGLDEEGEYTAITTDGDGDKVQYRFDWGDGTLSGWSELVNSGTPSKLGHMWEYGSFVVKAQARDEYGLEGPWSEIGLTVTVGDPPYIDNFVGPDPNKLSIGESGNFEAVAVDPQNFAINYTFDWGDGTYGYWPEEPGNYVPSGESVDITHAWNSAGSYVIKVKACNELGIESDWSTGITLLVGPILAVSTTILKFEMQADKIVSKSFEVWNDGTDSLDFEIIKPEESWLETIDPLDGSSSGQTVPISVTINSQNIEPGVYTCNIIVKTELYGQKTVRLKLTVLEPPHSGSSKTRSVTVSGNIIEAPYETSFSGTLVIDLLNANGDHVGSIWLFESNSVTYEMFSSVGKTKFVIERGGVIDASSETEYMETGPRIANNENIIYLPITQMVASPGNTLTSGTLSKLKTNSKGSATDRYDLRNSGVYGLRIQLSGDHTDAWADFFEDYDFQQDGSQDNSVTLLYEHDGAKLNLWHSYVEVALEL